MTTSRFVSRRRVPAFLVILGVAAGSTLGGQTRSPLDEVIALPEFKVVSERPLPPREEWSYVKLGNFEVLSSTAQKTTRDLVKDLREFQIVLSAISPHLLVQAELPVMVILCGRRGEFDRFALKPTARTTGGRATTLVRDGETAAIVVDYTVPTFGEEVMLASQLDGLSSRAGLRGMDNMVIVGRREIHTSEEFIRQYVHLSLSQMSPRMPAWAAEGLANIYSDIEYGNRSIQVGLPKSFRDEIAVEVPNSRAMWSSYFPGGMGSSYADAALVSPEFGFSMPFGGTTQGVYVNPIHLMPMEKLFAVGYDSPLFTGGMDHGVGLSGWRKQATAFVHMCLYGRGGKYQRAFVKFTTRTAAEPATEALFQECFGKTYKQMVMELRSYTDFTDYRATTYTAAKGENILLPAPKIEVRPATDGEIGRIKGETLRLAGQEEAARNEFVIAYLRGDREPQLLGSLGLMARRRHDDARAQTYLEAVGAAPTTIPRPRAYLELARLRSARHRAANRGAPLDAQQLASVLTPLFDALKLPQQLAEVYREIARAWNHTTFTPQRAHLAALEQGVRLFPRNGTLIVETAALLIKHGYAVDAAPLVQRAIDGTAEPELKAQLERLREQIDAAPSGRTGSALPRG